MYTVQVDVKKKQNEAHRIRSGEDGVDNSSATIEEVTWQFDASDLVHAYCMRS